MSRHSPRPCPEQVQDDAAAWFARRHGKPLDPEEEAAFAEWLAADPAHRDEYRILESIWNDSACLQAKPRAKRERLHTVGSLAGLAFLAVLISWLSWRGLDESIETAAGERRHVRLSDGSEVDLAPQSRLVVHIDGRQRRLELLRGQIVVEVGGARQPPFEVSAGGYRIRDIGTRFLVDTDSRQTRVAVASGLVEIDPPTGAAPWRLHAGESIALGAEANAGILPQGRHLPAFEWTLGRQSFDDRPLGEVIAALNRYRKQPIVLADPALEDIRISGVFLIDDEAATLRGLALIAPLRFVSEARQVTAYRQPPSAR